MMPRWCTALVFLAITVALTVDGTVRGQPGGKVLATVRSFDPKDGKEESLDYEVKKESPAGIEVVTGGGLKTIPPNLIVQVSYRGLPGVTLDQLTNLGIQEDNDPANAAQRYKELAAKASDRTKRFLEFRGAMAALKATGRKSGAEFEAEADATAKLLAEIGQRYNNSWEVWPAYRAAAQLRLELGQYSAAAKLQGQLAATPGLPADLRRDARFAEVGALLRAGQTKEAQTIINTMLAEPDFPRTGRHRQMATLYSLATKAPAPQEVDGKPVKPATTIKAIEEAIAQSSEPEAKAVGYGLLGDLYLAHGFPRDAMWSYLWVDLVFPEGKEERLLAVRRLASVFETLGEKERAEQYREKLSQVR